MNTEITPTPAKNRSRLYIIIGIVALVLLAAAAFIAGRMMNNGTAGGGFFGFGPQGGGEMMRVHLISAPELPAVEPETSGIYTHRDGNSIYVSPQDGIRVIMSDDGKGNVSGGLVDDSTGPEIEVVVTRDTQVFRDVTKPDFDSGSQEVQQAVEPGSLEDLNDQTFLSVWGRKTDNRIIADVIVYTIPNLTIKPANR